jgi:hypothetical protein
MSADRFKKRRRKEIENLLNDEVDKTASKPNIIDRYNGVETKGDLKNSMIKTAVETIGGGAIAPLISALFGKSSPAVGVLLALLGNYVGDKTGFLRGLAMATMAHGVAKSKEYREEGSTIKVRIAGFKDDCLYALMLKNTVSSSLNNVSIKDIQKYEVPQSQEVVDTEISNPENLSEKSEEKENVSLEKSEKQSELSKWVAEQKNKRLINLNSNTSKINNISDDKKDDPWDDVDFSRF